MAAGQSKDMTKTGRTVSNIVEELHDGIVALAGPRSDRDTRESMLSRAARAAGLNYRTAQRLYRREITDPRYSIVRAIREALARRAATAAEKQEAEANAELHDLRSRVERLECLIANLDRPPAPERRETIRGLDGPSGDLDRAVDR